jgi:hypothetical protein
MDLNRTGGVIRPYYEFTISLKDCWCGWDSLPPGFQFPVKKLVASLKDLEGELHKLSFFAIII